jgi:hypothetical protein
MYDIMMASVATTTPLRYEVNYRNYFLVTQGHLRILLIPPKDSKYLYPISDYDVFEFRSPVNPWKVQPEYQDDFDKIKTLEVELFQGMIMYIPAYWWYSIQFVVPETSVCTFKYRTHMNSVAILPHTLMNVLQNLNIKQDTLEKRTHIPDQFKPKSTASTVSPATNTGTGTGSGSGSGGDNKDRTSAAINPQHYDNQYLPSSLRNHHNPFSITATPGPSNIPERDNQVISSVLGTSITTESASASSVAAAAVAAAAAAAAPAAGDIEIVQRNLSHTSSIEIE